MRRKRDHKLRNWLFGFAGVAIFLIVFGGFVRLSRSGLSITEWRPASGVLLPSTEESWQEEFAKYQDTPEYRQVNRGMDLSDYKRIFLIEWVHRFIARAAGLVFALPFLVYLVRGRIPWRESGVYVAMGVLFLSQAAMGWIMVASGLVQRPSVSHYLLAGHLLLALSLVGLATWTGLDHHYGFHSAGRHASWSTRSAIVLVGLVLLLAQIVFGAFTAGLHAGLVSSTWPGMLGRLVPNGLFAQVQPPLLNIVGAPLTVAFIHRWLAFAVLATALFAASVVNRASIASEMRRPALLVVILGLAQIGLGIAVVMSRVDVLLALLHQVNAIALFLSAVYLLHRSRALDCAAGP